MSTNDNNFGLLDNRFLARSLGMLNLGEPLTVQQTEPISSVLSLLKEHKTGCVIVCNRQDQVVGIFTERDVLLKYVLNNLDVSTPVSEFMTPEPKTLQMTQAIAFALQMMSEGGYRHIPVVDEDSIPVGLISVKNLVDYVAKQITRDLQAFDV